METFNFLDEAINLAKKAAKRLVTRRRSGDEHPGVWRAREVKEGTPGIR
jgi:hypothetical protein